MKIFGKAPFRISFYGGGTDIEPYPSDYGGCCISYSINIGCFASIDVDKIFISAYSSSLDGKENISKTISGDIKDAEKLALKLADQMLQSGAKELTSN